MLRNGYGAGARRQEPPKEYVAIIEKVTGDDRRRMEGPPQLTEFVRDYVVGEFWPCLWSRAEVRGVLVKRVSSHSRLRLPLLGDGDAPSPTIISDLARAFSRIQPNEVRGRGEI